MRIKIHYTYFLVAFSFVLCGYFINLIIFTSIVLVHEFGHILMARLNGIKNGVITLYPYGGLLEFDMKVNILIRKELMIALGGFITQTLFYILIIYFYKIGIIREYVFNLFTLYYSNILFFNMLPIYPLDGAKIVRLILDYFLPYKLVNIMSIILSVVVLILVILFNIYEINYTLIMIMIVFINNLVKYYKNLDYYFNLFLLERYLYKNNFKKRRVLKNVDGMQRDKYHFFYKNGEYITEKQFLFRKFNRNR